MSWVAKKLREMTIQAHLVIGVVLLHAVLMSAFVFDLYSKQVSFIHNESIRRVENIASILATSARPWVMSRDIGGLFELINIKADMPDVAFTIITDESGKILVHTDRSKIGLVLSDSTSKKYLNQNSPMLVRNEAELVDFASPIKIGGRTIGWVRVSLSRENSNAAIYATLIEGLFYAFIAIFVGWIMASYLASYLTHGLRSLVSITNRFTAGERNLRVAANGIFEIDLLSSGFNKMLDELQTENTALKSSELALKKSEERFYLALKGANEGLWDWDLISNEVYFSDRWKSMLGYQPDEFKNSFEEWQIRLHPEDSTRALNDVQNHLKGNTPNYETEFRMQHKEGHFVWILARGFAVRDATSTPCRMVGTQFDLTERKRAESEKEQLFVQLRQSQKMEALGQLTGGIAHDFNNILGSILGFIEIAGKYSIENPKAKSYLVKAKLSGQRAVDLVKQMLTYSRGGDPNPKVVSVSEVINENVNLMRPILPANLKFNLERINSELNIKFDPVQFQQVLMNLCINSRDAINGQAGEISISADMLKHDVSCSSCGEHINGNYVVLTVKDSGSGISEENIKKIFEPFFTTKEQGKGTGMGLAMVHGIMHRHFGHLYVSAIPNVGTQFQLMIPLELSRPIALPAAEIFSEAIPARSVRVLLVDDEVDLNETTRLLLADYKIDCVSAYSGKQALDIFRKDSNFDLILTDFMMPEMTGSELISQIRKMGSDIPAVLITGNSTALSVMVKSQLAIDEILSKPSDMKTIAEIAHRIVNERSLKKSKKLVA